MIRIINESIFTDIEDGKFKNDIKDFPEYYAEKIARDSENLFSEYEVHVHEVGWVDSCVDWDQVYDSVNEYYGNYESLKDKVLNDPDSLKSLLIGVKRECDAEGQYELSEWADEILQDLKIFNRNR